VRKTELVSYLKAHPVFSQLAAEHVELLAKRGGEQSFAAGELLFRQQETAEQFFIVIEGTVKVEVPAIEGPVLEVQTLEHDDVLGWSWLIPPYKWTFEAKAATDVTVLTFDGKALLKQCEKDNAFGYALMKLFAGLMSERLNAARQKMMDNWAPAGWA